MYIFIYLLMYLCTYLCMYVFIYLFIYFTQLSYRKIALILTLSLFICFVIFFTYFLSLSTFEPLRHCYGLLCADVPLRNYSLTYSLSTKWCHFRTHSKYRRFYIMAPRREADAASLVSTARNAWRQISVGCHYRRPGGRVTSQSQPTYCRRKNSLSIRPPPVCRIPPVSEFPISGVTPSSRDVNGK